MGAPAIRPNHFDPTKPLPTLPSLSSNLQKRKRSPSKDAASSIKPNKVVKKSTSTPNMAKPSETGSSSGDEKKRNKLGYHRTSVACGHCRRRKIRCMMPDDDPTGRCSNCIRLKKECNFFPVDAANNGRGPHPPQRGNSLPTGGRSGQSPSPMIFAGQPGYADAFQPYGGHTSFSVPPPDTGLGLFNTSTQPNFPETPFTASSFEAPPTTWESSPYATLPPISGAPEPSPYGYGVNSRQFESPLSVSPGPAHGHRPSSSFRPSPYADSAYASGGKTPNNEIGWAPPPPQHPHSAMSSSFHRPSYSPPPHAINSDSSRQSEQPPSLVMSSETASTPTLSEPTTLGSMSAPAPGFWNPYGPTDALEHVSKPFPEPFETGAWFSEPLNSY
ncbi:MAG: hypothetical protein Q9159_002675 [Coniocarpon cinnabarinum]